jgi:hypothetical protein
MKETSNKIYPILKPGDWAGIKAGVLHQVLIGSPESPELVLGFGYSTDKEFIFLTEEDVKGQDVNQLINDAHDNLFTIPSHFEEVKIEQFGGLVLTASGNDFASEKILAKDHLIEAQRLLKAKAMLVSIPRRTTMMLVDKNANKEVLDLFMNLHDHTWNDDSYGNAPIFNAIFVVVDGNINGIIDMNPDKK